MAKMIGPQLLAGRARRGGVAGREAVRWEGFEKNVLNKVNFTLMQRMGLAVQLLESKVVANIGRPVTKSTGPRGGRVVTDRSKPGEFPKADTELLQKSIFKQVKKIGKGVEGYIGTPLHYGLILEVKLNRSFLVRSLNEEFGKIKQILTSKIK